MWSDFNTNCLSSSYILNTDTLIPVHTGLHILCAQEELSPQVQGSSLRRVLYRHALKQEQDGVFLLEKVTVIVFWVNVALYTMLPYIQLDS